MLATWLVASPANAVLALGASLIAPLLQPFGAVFVGMLSVARGVRGAIVLAVLAGSVVAVFSPFIGSSPLGVAVSVTTLWVPVIVLAAIWTRTRSTQLALQVSVLLALGGMLAFVAMVDVEAFWATYVDNVNAAAKEAGVVSPLEVLQSNDGATPGSMAALLTPASVAGIWMLSVVAFMLGGGLYNKLPGDRPKFGRFRDVDFGRVLAGLYVVTLVVAYASGAALAWQAGAVFTTVFLLQGFVVVHWLHLERHVPVIVVFIAYGLLLVLMQYAVATLAVVGFMDALFGMRRRLVDIKGSRQ